MSYSRVVNKSFGSHWSLAFSRSTSPQMMTDISKAMTVSNSSPRQFGAVVDGEKGGGKGLYGPNIGTGARRVREQEEEGGR